MFTLSQTLYQLKKMKSQQAYPQENQHTAPRAAGSDSLAVARALMQRLFEDTECGITVRLADGTRLVEAHGHARATIVAKNTAALRAIAAGPASEAAARAVIGGLVTVIGDVEYAIAQFERIAGSKTALELLAIGMLALRLPPLRIESKPKGRSAFRPRGRKHSLHRDRQAIAFHYDVSNEFFELWLDRELTYSCAYFRDETNTLDQAQLNKLDHICRKLRLRPTDRLLDIGCGWGSLIRFAAREYGTRSVGITLSERQAEYARRRIAKEGLEDRCSVDLRDYRHLAPLGPFDKVASVGMVEHVGTAMLPAYFGAAYDALAPGGLFLNHGIASQRRPPRGARALYERVAGDRSIFIERYVFPDGDLPRLQESIAAAELAGFETRDVENLREHYARTLRLWVRGLEANEARARALVGDETFNVWRFYMAGSANGFAIGRMGLDQVLLAKPYGDGTSSVPLTRADLYRA